MELSGQVDGLLCSIDVLCYGGVGQVFGHGKFRFDEGPRIVPRDTA